ncbi:MAG: peptidylprolyl isomerase [Parvularculaceae bacterium]|nr:peptidylprolyl isomerase [Parvularculaceae bacterium]
MTDGRRRAGPASGNPLLSAGRTFFRAVGKAVATVWRLAGALDSALWRGVKLGTRTGARAAAQSFRAAGTAIGEVFAWLPSRAGRAYAAGSGVILVLAALWIVDEIRGAASEQDAFEAIFRPPLDAADPIVARLDGRFVHLSEVEAAAKTSGQLLENEVLTVQSAFARELVAAYVEQRLLAKAALEEGLQRDRQVGARLSAARDRILAASYMQSRIDTAVTADRVRRLYESQADVTRLGDEVKARHILVATEADARAIVAALEAGGDFGAYARARSLDRATAPLGGEIGWFTKDMMAASLAGAAFTTPVGAIAPPFASDFGWHILEVLDRRPTRGVAFAAVEDNIRRFLTLRAIDDTLKSLKAEQDVLYFAPDPASSGAATDGS